MLKIPNSGKKWYPCPMLSGYNMLSFPNNIGQRCHSFLGILI